MTTLQISPTERKQHRSDAHHLNPVVMIGGDGLTPGVVKEVDGALRAHGLIKVRALNDDRAARESMLAELCEALDAAPVQHIGKLLILWRPIPAVTGRELAEDRGAGPRTVKIVKFSKSGNHRPQIKKVKVLGNQRVTAGGLVKRSKARKAPTSKKRALST